LTYELDLDVLEMFYVPKMKVFRSRLSKIRARTGQTDTRTVRPNDLQPHSRVVTVVCLMEVPLNITDTLCTLTDGKINGEVWLL